MRSLLDLNLHDLLRLAQRYGLLDDYQLLTETTSWPVRKLHAPTARHVWIRQESFARVMEEEEAVLFLGGLIHGYLRTARRQSEATAPDAPSSTPAPRDEATRPPKYEVTRVIAPPTPSLTWG